VYGKFGVELVKYDGDNSWTLPMPASYVIDSQGVIRYARQGTPRRHYCVSFLSDIRCH